MIRHERVGDVAVVAIERPERRNAVDAIEAAPVAVIAAIDGFALEGAAAFAERRPPRFEGR